MAGTRLTGAILHGALVEGCSFRGADMLGARLQGCDLTKADATGAQFSRTVDMLASEVLRAILSHERWLRSMGSCGARAVRLGAVVNDLKIVVWGKSV